jgi:hypothetical protein
MLESILNTVFSIPYLLIGTGLAAFIDIKIHQSKATTRFTFLEIWGCMVCWPLLVFTVAVMYLSTSDN